MGTFLTDILIAISLVILGYYFVGLIINFVIMCISLLQVERKLRVTTARIDLPEEALEPISILVPAFNEQVTILDAVHYDLKTQRIRWHKGLAQALWQHRGMLLRPRYGMVGMVTLPVFWLIELIGPVIELTGYIVFFLLLITGSLASSAYTLFVMAYLYGLLQSLIAVISEDRTSRIYLDSGNTIALVTVCFLEPLLYRPILTFWRCCALATVKKRSVWGSIHRNQLS